MKALGIAVLAGLAALFSGVIAGAGSAGTNGIAGGNIVFSALDPTDGMSDIYVMKADETATTNITHDASLRKDLSPAWSPDGSKVVFTRVSAKRTSSIVVVNADGTGLTDMTPDSFAGSSIVGPRWSPDGTRVVFSSNRDGNYDLYWLKVGSPTAARLTKTSAPVQNLDPAWSPSGKAIVFSRSGSLLTGRSADLFQLSLPTGQAARLTKTAAGRGDVSPVYSPDGGQIAFSSDRAGNEDVYLLNLAGPYLNMVTTSEKADSEPSFSPDGTALVYVSNRTGATELWAQTLIGLSPGPSEPVQLTSDGQFKAHPGWGLDTAQPEPVPFPAAPPASKPVTLPPIAATPAA